MASSRETFGVLLLLLAVSMAAPAPHLEAQSQGADELTRDSTIAQHLATAPTPGTWEASGTFGLQFQDGRVDTRGYTVDAIFAHTTGGGTMIRLDAEWTRAEARPAPGQPMFVLDDTRFASLSAARRLGGRFGIMTVASWREDIPVGLDHRIMGQVGPYFALVARPQLKISTIPLVGAGRQDNAGTTESEGIVLLGGIQSLTWHPTRTATLEVYLSGHKVIEESDDYSLLVNTSLTAALSRHLGLRIFYRLSEEGVHPVGTPSTQHTFGAGLHLAFPTLQGG